MREEGLSVAEEIEWFVGIDWASQRFPPTRLSVGCGFRKETIAGMRRNGRDAPTADVPALAPERGDFDKVGLPRPSYLIAPEASS